MNITVKWIRCHLIQFRGVFTEGGPIYPNAGFVEKTHIQICIINPNCIKGYFAPLAYDEEYGMP